MEATLKVLFGGQVTVAITTKAFGEVHPDRKDFTEQLARLKKFTASNRILFPSIGFTNQVVQNREEIRVSANPDETPLPGFMRSVFKADGAISKNLPIAICNGDCPAGIAITTPDKSGQRHLVFMHLGLMSMISKTGRSSLIKEVVRELRFQKMAIDDFWMGFGARPCCYGLSHGDDRWDLIRRWQPNELTVGKGPLEGQGGVDLGAIARTQLLTLGVRGENIEVDDLCTVCCGGSPQAGKYFSNLMMHGEMASNVVVARLMP